MQLLHSREYDGCSASIDYVLDLLEQAAQLRLPAMQKI